MASQVRVRFAPSPTGSLHLGGVRTALYNYLIAKHYKGQFIIRVEDTDLDRNQERASEMQLADLEWLGLQWDEGPDIGGAYKPYKQSQRLDVYKDFANQLIEQGKAFYCFLTDEELDKMHSHDNRQILSPYRTMAHSEALEKVNAGESHVVRFRNDAQEELFSFNDLVHGDTGLKGNMVGDFVLLRSNGLPVYNFCCVIDDHLMEISHVLRGEEHLSNTLRQVMLYDAFGWERPKFGHLSMILGANRKKLSKRDDAVAMKDFIDGGYLPEALLNYVALLGWSHADSKEKFTLDEMIQDFALDRVNKSPAMFDRDKLNWLNHYHMNQKSSDDILKALVMLSDKYEELEGKWFGLFWQLIGHQFNTLKEVSETLKLFETYDLRDKELLLGEGRQVAELFLNCLKDEDSMNEAVFSKITSKIGSDLSVKGKRLFAPIRVSLIGRQSGMELTVLAQLMDREEMLKRVTQALG